MGRTVRWWWWHTAILIFIYSTASASALTFDRYHTQSEISAYLKSLARTAPNFTHHHLGYSRQGRPIEYVVVSLAPSSNKPAIYLNATHHGDEWASTEALLRLLNEITLNFNSPFVQSILSRFTLIFHPIVNPDGHAKHSREDSSGLDLNRDYLIPGRPEETAFQTPETQLIRSLLERYSVRGALAFHAGMEGVLYAWAHTHEKPRDEYLFRLLANETAKAMGVKHVVQSFTDYQTQGEFIDYAYMRFQALALTIEVSQDVTPPPHRLPLITAHAVAGSMAYLLKLAEIDESTTRRYSENQLSLERR